MPEERRFSPYADDYSYRYASYMKRKRNERQGSSNPLPAPRKIESPPIQQRIIRTLSRNLGENSYYPRKPRSLRWLKILAVLVVLVFIAFILIQNFVISKDFNYFYDIGSSQDAKTPYLTPANRVSAIINDSGTDYRNLIGHLVYFDVPIPTGAKTIEVNFKFFNNDSESYDLKLGARDHDIWDYTFHSLNIPGPTGKWETVQADFNLGDEHLLPINGKLNMAFYSLHLYNGTGSIPIDWINITVHRGLF
jgi:hypothetical protein